MIQFFHDEKWKEFKPGDFDFKFRYAVSNYGRVVSFSEKIENGRLLKIGKTEGYKIMTVTRRNNNKVKVGRIFIYRLVAEKFIPKDSEDKTFVLHLDHSRDNDRADNLKWATKEEMLEHSKKSPYVIASKKNFATNMKRNGHKLTPTQVLFIKKKLLSPNRKTRLKIIAKQFGVSEMTLQRIRTGENWAHIIVPNDEKEKPSL